MTCHRLLMLLLGAAEVGMATVVTVDDDSGADYVNVQAAEVET